ncbi:TetR/AcrR family transcriptional regulator [Nocardioides sp. LML1-1-1.1]
MAPAERREQLLDAVLRVVAEQGVHKVSIDVVAREAGVTRPVVYAHFADSNALLRASLDREEQGALEQMARVLPDGREESFAESAVATFGRYLDAVLEEPERWRAIFMIADSSTPAFRARLDRGRRGVVTTLETALETALDAAGTATDVPVLARLLVAVAVESGRTVLTEPEDFPPARLRAFAEQQLRRLLAV